jgi:hypothetical protein
MPKILKPFALGAGAYSILISPLIYIAACGRVPNDAGIMIYISSMPTGSIINIIGYMQTRARIAQFLNLLVNDRFAMIFDASVGWAFGCIQWGIVAVIIWHFYRVNRKNLWWS